ncbi:MAG: Abi family protein [Succinimonas sp.]|nr:Abi family protein [Succinimonas sp.]
MCNTNPPPLPPKPFQTYSKQIQILQDRGMVFSDLHYAQKKLAEVSYYRLSGFWYIFREIAKDSNGNIIYHSSNNKIPKRLDRFIPNTEFKNVFDLYLFDKTLRLLMLDALERIEVFIRSLIAYEMGKSDPLVYKEDKYIDSKFLLNSNNTTSAWDRWVSDNQNHIDRSYEDCIIWHHNLNREIPIWVVTEVWDFGLMSRYFSMLRRKYKNKICGRIDRNLTPDILNNWLRELNILRNRCAHHTRIWNQVSHTCLSIPQIDYFKKISLQRQSLNRMSGNIAILWFLVNKMGSSSTWLDRISELLKSQTEKSYFSIKPMGFTDNWQEEILRFKKAVL